MSKARSKARRNAVQALYQWQLTGADVSVIEEQFLIEHDMQNVDVEYFRELLREVPLHLHELDDHLIEYLDRPINEVDPVERAILRMSTYELEFRLDVPYKAVINEGVEMAKIFGAEHGHKYVNGILDRVARKLRSTEIQAAAQKKK
ncbi:transcription antitermination factor NusB [Sulfuriflexus sp.]|uniref:transcription antitermination factor NusB n=1 Tax=Sulfuriflexus sp. TaxID=2015443 RepID=UPI0028CF4B15|nr:transcription antitermination factor NusB [Sulfuriflexus sp.]MDT8403280.1 transcription antitermination factor NusB [Sulfuriflexus sp.]